MSANTMWSDRLTMLMACASPGSAFAYHLGLTTFKPAVLRRDKTTQVAEKRSVGTPDTSHDSSTTKVEPELAIWLREGAR
jgi:hypothetical protein